MIELITKENEDSYTHYNFSLIDCKLHLVNMYVVERVEGEFELKLNYEKSYHRYDPEAFGIKEEPEINPLVVHEAIRSARRKITFERRPK